ncbi:hypothetical protein EIN_086590 [Entamoeba invadens IP1]|uniref:hypothetical protein n=1 Tax=Entamoeba invadens IP1 TaxID=370355 RepID=UPI0002C3E51D|nr:hypothetical protein EIN_086590 [Entamoeba invadens IP1]ELP85377.1 hypothetical protein EIN_086590 [Entamoeba invadens IP1]|eukprot:XP_004184723.1 hypothetical protein EIN_086590 [Entamoeba invadens IP1]
MVQFDEYELLIITGYLKSASDFITFMQVNFKAQSVLKMFRTNPIAVKSKTLFPLIRIQNLFSNDDIRIDGLKYKICFKMSYDQFTRLEGKYDYQTNAIDLPQNITLNEIPDCINSIGKETFSHTSFLTSIVISTSVTSIESFAFTECPKLSSLILPNTPILFMKDCFHNLVSLTSCSFPDKSFQIPCRIFSKENNLSALTLPATLRVAPSFYEHLSHLTSLRLKGKSPINAIIPFRFANELEAPIEKQQLILTREDFCQCFQNVQEFLVPEQVVHITRNCFEGYTTMTAITFSKTVSCIGKKAFAGCAGLKELTFPESVSRIHKFAFDNCFRLRKLVFEGEFPQAKAKCFRGCKSIKEVVIQGNRFVNKVPFFLARKVVKNPKMHSVFRRDDFNQIYNNKMKRLEIVCDGILSLGEEALKECNLEEVVLDDTIKGIPSRFFKDSKSLVHVTLPTSLKCIEAEAFAGCESLESINIPILTRQFGRACFENCKALGEILYKGKPMKVDKNWFKGCDCLTKNQLIKFKFKTKLQGKQFHEF